MINYNNPDDLIYASQKDLLITDGTVTVSVTSYTVTGATVTITNEIIESESFELKQSLCSNTQIQFGSCESGSVTFTIHENIPSTKGKTLKVYLIPDNDASKMLQIGVFKVAEDKLSADRTKRTITAYDAMYDILNSDVAAWYLSEFPTASTTKTLATLRADFLTHFGITAESTTLANDGITISRTIEPETLSGADVIKAICEINGVFGQITNEGKFRYVELSPDLDAGLFPSETLYPADDLYPEDVNHSVDVIHHAQYIDVTFEDYMSEAITRLTVRNDDKDAGVTVGTAGNTYVITGNFLVYGYNATQLTSVATAILNKIKNRYYKPCTVNAIGNPLHEVGDGIRIRTTYRGIVSYILERRLTGIQALRDTYSANGERLCDGQLNTTATQLNARVKKDTILNDLNAKIDQDVLTVTPSGINFKSTGAITINTANFTLDEDGNAEFAGTIRGAVMTGTNKITARNNSYACELYAGYLKVGALNSGGTAVGDTDFVILDGDNLCLYVRDNTAHTIGQMYSDSLTIGQNTSDVSSKIFHVDEAGVYINTETGAYINGNAILTSLSNISASKITGTLSGSQLPSTIPLSILTYDDDEIEVLCKNFSKLIFHSEKTDTDFTLKQILDACNLT